MAARIPSSVPVGGIRMSVTTTSGRSVAAAAHERVVVGAGRHDLEVVLGVDELLDALAHDVVVLGEDDPQDHGPEG